MQQGAADRRQKGEERLRVEKELERKRSANASYVFSPEIQTQFDQTKQTVDNAQQQKDVTHTDEAVNNELAQLAKAAEAVESADRGTRSASVSYEVQLGLSKPAALPSRIGAMPNTSRSTSSGIRKAGTTNPNVNIGSSSAGKQEANHPFLLSAQKNLRQSDQILGLVSRRQKKLKKRLGAKAQSQAPSALAVAVGVADQMGDMKTAPISPCPLYTEYAAEVLALPHKSTDTQEALKNLDNALTDTELALNSSTATLESFNRRKQQPNSSSAKRTELAQRDEGKDDSKLNSAQTKLDEFKTEMARVRRSLDGQYRSKIQSDLDAAQKLEHSQQEMDENGPGSLLML